MLIRDINLNACPSTSILDGLNQKLIKELDTIAPGALVSIAGMTNLSLGPAAHPFVGGPTAKAKLQAAINSRGQTLVINSAYRTVAQQFLLFRMFHFGPSGNCGMTAVAKPGKSNHESGLALDIQNPLAWKTFLEVQGWKHLGPFDPPHYDFRGGTDLRKLGVIAFQSYWNKNNPSDKLAEPLDGLFGPQTEKRLLKTPVNGF
jgi:N-acetylmuramoyl-L-alanine amidase